MKNIGASFSRYVGAALVMTLTAACSDREVKSTVVGPTTDSGTTVDSGGLGKVSDAGKSADSAPSGDAGGPDYADPSRWLCLPGATNDLCHGDLDATVVYADGTTKIEPHVFAKDPPLDCFYVYPTVSTDPSGNSDLVPGKEEISVTKNQAARLSSVCTVYAPLYRQVTLTALLGGLPATTVPDREMPYADALEAWQYYLDHYNKGRPFVLIGHSQGAGVLKRLVQEKIDSAPALRSQLVSAFLIGGNVAVPDGKDVGVDFQNVPLCRNPSDKQCVVAYSTFRATAPPPSDSLFGKPRSGPGVVACNDPAALQGGAVAQDPYFLVSDNFAKLGSIAVTTPFVRLPNLLQGECVSKGGYDYLELTFLGDATDVRPREIGGDLTPQWGLHLVDVNIAMGDIVSLVKAQAAGL